jgi:hypothetical protein
MPELDAMIEGEVSGDAGCALVSLSDPEELIAEAISLAELRIPDGGSGGRRSIDAEAIRGAAVLYDDLPSELHCKIRANAE